MQFQLNIRSDFPEQSSLFLTSLEDDVVVSGSLAVFEESKSASTSSESLTVSDSVLSPSLWKSAPVSSSPAPPVDGKVSSLSARFEQNKVSQSCTTAFVEREAAISSALFGQSETS